MKNLQIKICALLGWAILLGCTNRSNTRKLSQKDVCKVINQMTEVMLHDVTNPPLASRFFAYTCLAGYEVTSQNNRSLPSMNGRLQAYPKFVAKDTFSGKNYELSAILAMYLTAEKLQPSGMNLMAKNEQAFIDSCRLQGFEETTINISRAYAQTVSKTILAYAKADRYNRISNFRRYSPTGSEGSWSPTPPSYMPPVEPYFNTVRPMTFDSTAQFPVEQPIVFSTDKHSEFYRILLLNYAKGSGGLTDKEKNIANFWDCNPFAVQNEGHVLIGLKKISPGAHWMGIAAIACDKDRASFSKAIEVNTVLAIGLFDGFIYCWDQKYRTNRIRPETAIHRYIDPGWKPFLQTPPFPEYLSGHSVISSISAVILTSYFGQNFHYTDNVEIGFGIPPRKFSSFTQAANEASISRFWGGIHFLDAIEVGIKRGNELGARVLARCKEGKNANRTGNK